MIANDLQKSGFLYSCVAVKNKQSLISKNKHIDAIFIPGRVFNSWTMKKVKIIIYNLRPSLCLGKNTFPQVRKALQFT